VPVITGMRWSDRITATGLARQDREGGFGATGDENPIALTPQQAIECRKNARLIVHQQNRRRRSIRIAS
jgi:hypothetical protein